jgi:GNAT superfamily N-acetyltransferase
VSTIDPQRPWIVRAAHSGDHATIVEFNARLAQESEGKQLEPIILARGVRRALAEPDRLRYWVVELKDTASGAGRIIGQAAVTQEWSDWRNGWLWWFQSVYVHPEHRRQGVFRSLHQAIRDQALARPDVIGLRLYVEDGNDRAQRTYQAMGMAPGGYHVYEEFWLDRALNRRERESD